MKKILVAAVAATVLVPIAAFGVEATGKVKTWDAEARKISLENDVECRLTAAARVPSDLAVGKEVVLSYIVFENVTPAENLCRSVIVK